MGCTASRDSEASNKPTTTTSTKPKLTSHTQSTSPDTINSPPDKNNNNTQLNTANNRTNATDGSNTPVNSPTPAGGGVASPMAPLNLNKPDVVPRLDEHTRRLYEKTPHMYAQTFKLYPTDFFLHYMTQFHGIFTMPDLLKLITDCYTILVRDIKEMTWRDVQKIDVKKERERTEKMTQQQKKQYVTKQIADINATPLDIDILLKFMPYSTSEDNIHAIARYIMHKLGVDGYITQLSFSTGWELHYESIFNLNISPKNNPLSDANMARRRRLLATIIAIASSSPPVPPRRILLTHSLTPYYDENVASYFDSAPARILRKTPYKIISPSIAFTQLEAVWQYYAAGSQRMQATLLMAIARDIVFCIVSDLKQHCEELLNEQALASGYANNNTTLNPSILTPNKSESILDTPLRTNSTSATTPKSDLLQPFLLTAAQSTPQPSNAIFNSDLRYQDTIGTAIKLANLIAQNKPLHIIAYKTLTAALKAPNTQPPSPTATNVTATKHNKKMDKARKDSTRSISGLSDRDDDSELRGSFMGRQSMSQPNNTRLNQNNNVGSTDALFTLPALLHQYVENVLPFYFDQSDDILYSFDDAEPFLKMPNEFNFKNLPTPFTLDQLCPDTSLLDPPTVSNNISNDINNEQQEQFSNDIALQRYDNTTRDFYSRGRFPSPSKTLLNRIYIYLNFHLDHSRQGFVAKQSFMKYFIPVYCRLFDYQQIYTAFNIHSYYSPNPIMSTSTLSMTGNYGTISSLEHKFFWNNYTIFSSIDEIDFAKWAATSNAAALRLRGNISNDSNQQVMNAADYNKKTTNNNGETTPSEQRFESGISVDIISRSTFRAGKQPLLRPLQLNIDEEGIKDNLTTENFNVIDIWNLPLLQPFQRPMLPDLINAGALTDGDLIQLQLTIKQERELKLQRRAKAKLPVSPSMSKSNNDKDTSKTNKDKKEQVLDDDSDRESFSFMETGIDKTLVTHRHLTLLRPTVDVLNFYSKLSHSYSMLNNAIESSAPGSPLHTAPSTAIAVSIHDSDGMVDNNNDNNNNLMNPPQPTATNSYSAIFAPKTTQARLQPPHMAPNMTRSQQFQQLSINVTALQTPMAIPIQTVHLTISNQLLEAIKHRCRTIDYFVNPANTTPTLSHSTLTALTLPSLITFYHNSINTGNPNASSSNLSISSFSQQTSNQMPRSPSGLDDDSDRSSFRQSSTFGFLRSSINQNDPISPGIRRQCGHIDHNGTFTSTNPLQTQIETSLDRERIRRLTWLSLTTLTDASLLSFPILTPYRTALDQRIGEKGSLRQLMKPGQQIQTTPPTKTTALLSPEGRRIGKGVGPTPSPTTTSSSSPVTSRPRASAPPPVPSFLDTENTVNSKNRLAGSALGGYNNTTQDQLSIQAAFLRRGSIIGESDEIDTGMPKKRYSVSSNQQPSGTGNTSMEPLVVSTSGDLGPLTPSPSTLAKMKLDTNQNSPSNKNNVVVSPNTPTNVGNSSTISPGGLRGSGKHQVARPQPRQRRERD